MPGASTEEQIAHFRRTGDTDPCFLDWPGQNIFEKGQSGTAAMIAALLAEVKALEALHARAAMSPSPLPTVPVAFTRRLVEPMMRGLFPRSEADPVLAVLERSVVFLSPRNIVREPREACYLSTTWSLTNICLGNPGAPTLSAEPWRIVGCPEETRCYVEPRRMGTRSHFIPKKAFQLSRSVKHPDDLDSVFPDRIEDEVVWKPLHGPPAEP